MANPQGAKIGRTYIPFTGQVKQINLRMSSQDIAAWKQAIDQARNQTNPKRRLLYELYENIKLDGHLLSVMGKRKSNITNKKVHFTLKEQEGEVDEAVRDLILETPWFYKMMGFMADAKPWGHSLVELIPNAGLIQDTKLVPRINVKPETGFVAYDAMNDMVGIHYREDPQYSKYLIETGDVDDYGLLMTAAQYVIYKRGGFGDWAQFAELFGMPFRIGKYNPYDDSTRIKLEEALRDMGGAAHVVIPDGTAIEFKDNNGTGKSEVFKDLVNMCNAELSKIFLGQTMTTEQGDKGARSLGEVHESVEDGITLSDMIELEYKLNWDFANKLRMIGYKIPEGRFNYPETESIPMDKRLEMDIKLSEKIDISQEYFYTRYGIPKPKPGELPVNANKTAPNDPEADPETGEDPKAETGKPTPGSEKKKPQPGKKTKVEASAGHTDHCCLTDYINRYQVNASADLTPEEENLLQSIFESKAGPYDPVTLSSSIEKLKSGLQKGLPLSIAYNDPDYVAAVMMELNINRFGFDKNVATIYALNQALDMNETFDQFKVKASSILSKYNHAHLETEYNFAIAAAQNASAWIRQKSQNEIFPYLQYQTVGDQNVRPAHQALDGAIFNISDPSWRAIYPPNGYNCRCEMIQLRASEVDRDKVLRGTEAKGLLGDEWDKMVKGGFAVNRGDTHEVFNLNKGYLEDLPSAAKAKASNLTYKDIGLPDMSDLKGTLKEMKKSASSSPEAILQDFDTRKQAAGSREVVIYKDYSGRPVALTRAALEKHLKGKYLNESEERHKIFSLIGEVLTDPSEVYAFEYKKGVYQYRFVKFYQGEAMAVNVQVDPKAGLDIQTWYKVKESNELQTRSGFLVKKGKD